MLECVHIELENITMIGDIYSGLGSIEWIIIHDLLSHAQSTAHTLKNLMIK